MTVASQFALRMDTFDGKDIDDYSKGVQELLTTKYKSEFEKQLTVQAGLHPGPGGRDRQGADGGVASYDDDSATVLVVHDGSVKSKLGSPRSATSAGRSTWSRSVTGGSSTSSRRSTRRT